MPRCLVLALCLAPALLPAQQGPAADPSRAARPERPTVATHAFAVARGYLEFEAGGARVRRDGARDASAILSAKLGVAEHVQLTLIGSLTSTSPGVTAADPVYAGFKWQLTDERAGRPTFALLPGVTLATGPRRARDAALSLMGVVSHAFGPVAMDLNVAATRLNGVDGRLPFLWAASFGGPLRGRVGWGLEAYGSGDDAGTQPTQLLGFLGYTVRPWLVFDAGTSVPAGGSGARTIFAGATYNVGRVFTP